MFTIISVIGRIFSNSIANLYQKKASVLSSPIMTNLSSYFFMSVMCIVPALFIDWTQFSLDFWINVIIAGLLCTIGTIALIEALRIGELSVLAPINSYKSVVGLFGACVLLGEIPCVKDLLCVIFIIIGSLFVLEPSNGKFSLNVFLRRDVRLRIFALLCSGIEASFLKKIILLSSFDFCLILWCFSVFICTFVIFLIKKEKFIVAKENISNCLMIAVMLLVMQLTTNYVFSKIEVGVALALFQLSSLVSLYFGYKVFNEKNIVRKIVGTIIMITSAILIFV